MSSGGAVGGGKKPVKQRKVFTLWVHDVHFSPVDLVINPEHFPSETKVGDIVEIYKQGHKEKALYLAIGAITAIRANLHISVKDTIANACELTNREEIVANVVAKENVAVDFAEVTFKDQFISRSDMWRLKMHLKETCAYVGKSIAYSCIRASIRELLSSEQVVHSGYITANTKIVFRSRSAEYIMLFQMSKEMWDFAPDGQLYFEKAVNKFLPALFAKWRALGANHCLTMVMFSRTYYNHADLFDLSAPSETGDPLDPPFHTCRMDATQRDNLLRDHEGRYYHDFYTVVCIEERTNWERVVLQLKTKFEEYPYMVNWKLAETAPSPRAADKYHSNVLGVNAVAEYSGFLEAINLAQNMLDSRHFIDRDLTRTGQSVVVISAGTGIFIVNPSLEQQTKQRMIDKGIGCDLVCLTKPPSHVVPLFIMRKPYESCTNKTTETHSTHQQNSGNSSGNFATLSGTPIPTTATTTGTPSTLLPPSSAYSLPTKTFKLSFPSHKIAHWVYLFFHDWHVQHDHYGSSNRSFTATCTMPDYLQQNNACTGVIIPIKMSPHAPASLIPPSASNATNSTPSSNSSHNKSGEGANAGDSPLHQDRRHPSTPSKLSKSSDQFKKGANQSTSGSPSSPESTSIDDDISPHPTSTVARTLIGATPDAASEKLGILHHMEMELAVPEEISYAEKMSKLMDAYDASLFAAPASANVSPHTSALHGTGANSNTPTSKAGGNTLSTQAPTHAHHAHHQSTSSALHHTSSMAMPMSARHSVLAVPNGAGTPGQSHPSGHHLLHASTSAILPVPRRAHGSPSTTPSSAALSIGSNAVRTPAARRPAGVAPATPVSSSTHLPGSVSTPISHSGTALGASGVGAAGVLATTPSTASSSAYSYSDSAHPLRTPSKVASVHASSFTGTPHSEAHASSLLGASASPTVSSPSPHTAVGSIELNPFTLELKPAPPASNRRRWEHLWTRHSIQFDFLESDPSGPHWKSLTQPASLPLTTSYFPTPKELKDSFQFYTHSVDPDDSVHPMTLEAHLSELIAQRLVQGAQIMLPDGVPMSANSAQLSAGNSFHQLTIKSPTIVVNWYVAKNKVLDHERIRYRYFLWTEHTSRRLSKEVLLHYKSIIHYPWNTLDQLLSGYQLEFMDNYNYWNINMMLVPSDSKMSTSAAVAGFNKFKEFLNQRMVKLSDPDFGPMHVEIHATTNPSSDTTSATSSGITSPANDFVRATNSNPTLATSTSASATASANSNTSASSTASTSSSTNPSQHSQASARPSTRSTSTSGIGALLNSTSPTTIPELIDSHNSNLIISALKESNLVNEKYFKSGSAMEQKSYVFIASKVVDWMTSHVNVRNRPEAIDICAGFVASGIFKPISLPAGSPFRDGANYYSIVDPTHPPNGGFLTSASSSFSSPSLSSSFTSAGTLGAMGMQPSASVGSFAAGTQHAPLVGGSLKTQPTQQTQTNATATTGASSGPGGPAAVPPGSAPLDRRHAMTPGPQHSPSLHGVSSPTTSRTSAETENYESISNSDAGILNTSQHLVHPIPHHHNHHSSHHPHHISVFGPDSQSSKTGKSVGNSSVLAAAMSDSTQIPVVVKPGSQPVGTSPLDIDLGDGSGGVGGGGIGFQSSSVSASSAFAHTLGVGSVRGGFGVSMEEEHRIPGAMPHHTRAPSGTFRLQMDPSKADRYEWVNVSYDTIFDPSVAYEFQFQWLCSTGCVLSEFVTQLTRKAKSFGFSLVQIPVRNDANHSFLSPRKDSFAWSELSSAHQLAVCHVLVKVLDFLPRKRPNQFIHRSGVIMIDISNNIFEWSVNWTDVTAYTTAQNYELLKRFRDFMTQVNILKAQSSMPGQPELTYSQFLNGLLQCVAPYAAMSLQIFQDRASAPSTQPILPTAPFPSVSPSSSTIPNNSTTPLDSAASELTE